MTQYDWIDIREEPQVGKTRRFTVWNSKANVLIGRIQWYGPFRSYAFFPGVSTVYEKDCLRDIAECIEELSWAHKRKAKGYY